MLTRISLVLLVHLRFTWAESAESSSQHNLMATLISDLASKMAANQTGSTDAPLPTLTPTKTTTPASDQVPQGIGVGMHGIMATVNSTGTNPATAPWATKTSGGMAAFSDDLTTIVVHTDSSIECALPFVTSPRFASR